MNHLQIQFKMIGTMSNESILMITSEYQQTGGHNVVINNLCKGLNKLGYNTVIGAFSFNEKPPEDLKFIKLNKLKGFSKKINGYEFALIHNHQTRLNYYSLLSKNLFLFHFHGTMGKIQEINLNLSLNLCQNHISKIISVSNSAFSKIPKHIQNKIPSEEVYNGVDTNFFNPNSIKKFTYGEPQLIFVGSLTAYKNVKKIINSMDRIMDIYPNVHLMVVGEGDEYSKLNDDVKVKGLTKNVSFLGKILSHEELRDRYRSSDIYISASTIEACPLPPIEAMACGKPLLLSDIPAHRELIKKSKGGLIFSLTDSDLTQKLTEVYENRRLLGKLARKFAKENDWINVCKKISKIYEQIFND